MNKPILVTVLQDFFDSMTTKDQQSNLLSFSIGHAWMNKNIKTIDELVDKFYEQIANKDESHA